MRTAWLALLLLGSISAVAAMLTGSWRAPAAADATPDQTAAVVEPVDDSPVKAPNWPDLAARQDTAARQEVAARQVVDPDPAPDLRGGELPATPFPATADTMANTNANASANINLASRHWHAAGAGAKMPMANVANAQQIKRIRDSKAEMRAKRSKAAANTRTTCAPSTNNWTNLLRKLTLLPTCTI
jgi:hypothetical protein